MLVFIPPFPRKIADAIMTSCYSAYSTWTKITLSLFKSAIVLSPVDHLFFLLGLSPLPKPSCSAHLCGTLAKGSPFVSIHGLSETQSIMYREKKWTWASGQCHCLKKPSEAWQQEFQRVLTLKVRRESAKWRRVVWFCWSRTPHCGWRNWSRIHPLGRRANKSMVSGHVSNQMNYWSG